MEVTGTNPSDFPGDLRRAISSVTWFDATNYSCLFTQRELAAGRIPVGSKNRLPREAEWECASLFFRSANWPDSDVSSRVALVTEP